MESGLALGLGLGLGLGVGRVSHRALHPCWERELNNVQRAALHLGERAPGEVEREGRAEAEGCARRLGERGIAPEEVAHLVGSRE